MEKGKSRSSSASTRTPKVERKIIEKNRRNRMKSLYSNLLSLLPDHGSKKAMHLPDQVDEVVAYIENLKIKVEKMKEKKEKFLLPRKGSNSCITSEIQAQTNSSTSTVPIVEVQDMGPNMDVILVTGLDDLSKFYSILKLLLHEDGIEVAKADFCSIQGHSIIHILHDKVGKSRSMGVGVTTMSTSLKDLICGIFTCSSKVESNTDLWDSEIQSQLWGFGNLEFIEPYMSLECYQGYM